MSSTPNAGLPGAPTAWHTRLVRADTSSGWRGRGWTSGVLEAGLPDGAAADQAIVSWNLDPRITALVELRARTVDGVWQPWQEAASWGGAGARRSPARADGDGDAATGSAAPGVDVDILTGGRRGLFDAVQVRITCHEGTENVEDSERRDPRPLRLAAVSFSAHAGSPAPADHATGRGVVGAAAAVQPLSQRAYPARDDLGGGGPAWCSPTSLAMVAAAWGVQLPSASSDDVPPGADPHVPWLADAVYDAAFDGTGNWSFNAAVAGELGLDAVVTRLSSLRSARAVTDAGIPLIASISFGAGELPGADYDTAGHLLVVRGFDANGDVLVADPANPGGPAGLRTYPRVAFDTAWSHSRRTVYLITPRGSALPAGGAAEGW